MDLICAFATDEKGVEIPSGHFGSASHYAVYRISTENYEFIEVRENAKIEEDETKIHGDPNKANSVKNVLKGINVLVGRAFGPNIKRVIKKFACVIVTTELVVDAANLVKSNLDDIYSQYQKGEGRKHIVLR